MPTTYYDVLGVDADASQEAIRDAYREKVKEHHPDVSDHPDAEERFKLVKRAEIVLSDPDERDTYDRLGHEAYVDGDDPEPNRPSDDEVRWAAARAAEGDHDPGGRSAGWRERERRARRSERAEWFVGGENGGRNDSGDGVGDARSARRAGADAGRSTADARGSTTGSRGSNAGTGGSSTDARRSTTDAGRAPADAAGGPNATTESRRRHAAARKSADGWGDVDAHATGHAVHEWTPERRDGGIPTPGWTQDDIVLLGSSILLYPLLLFLTAAPAFPIVARIAIGICALAMIAFLLPRPAFGLPVFGTWSLLGPAFLLGFGVSPISAIGIVVLGGVWLPLCYSITVAMVLAR